MEKVLCRGTNKETGEKCNEVSFYREMGSLLLVAPSSRLLRVMTDPLRLKCRWCGYEQKLFWKDRKH